MTKTKKPIFGNIKNIDFKSKLSSLKQKYAEYSYLGCAFLIPVLVFWMVYICFQVYPFGNGSVLVLDLNGQYVFFFEALRNAVFGDTSLIYSWSRSLGGEFIGIYAYYIASPLSYLVCLFPQNHITEALLAIILIKTGLSGATMAFYLKKTRPATKELAVVIFSTMYALSAYAVTYAHNTMWIDAMMLLPLTIYGLEKLVTEHKFKLFVFSLTLTLISTFYIGYMVCFFILIYFFYYYFTESHDYRHNYYGEKLHFLKSLLRVGIASASSLLMAAFIILPTYYSLTFGKTTFTKTTWEFVTQFDFLDFFAKMLPGSYDTVRPEGLPFVYCGTLALIMVPVFFAAKKIPLRHKIGAAAILAVVMFAMNSMVLDTFLHGMQRPNWLNYRYSFVFIFLVIVFACRGFEQILTVKPAFLCSVGAVIIALTLVIQKVGFSHLDEIIDSIDFPVLDDYMCIWLTIICVIACLACLSFVISKKMKNVTLTALAVVVCLELFGSSLITSQSLNLDVGMSSRQGYVEFFERVRPIVTKVQNSDKTFYRMEKTVSRSVCDDLALNIRGIGCSTSTLNASVIEFLDKMGYASSSHWSKYAGGTLVSDSLLGMKYLITEKDAENESDLLTPYMSDEEAQLYAYLNTYALSIAYSSNPAIKDFDPSLYPSPFDAMNALVTALLGEDETVQLFKPIEHSVTMNNAYVSYDGVVYETVYDDDGKEQQISVDYYFYKPKNAGSPGKLTYNFTISSELENVDTYFFFPTNYPRKVDWELNEWREEDETSSSAESTDETQKNPSGVVLDHDCDCIQSLGMLNVGSDYTLTLTMNEQDNIFYIMKDTSNDPDKPDRLFSLFYYLDKDVFKDKFDKLQEGNLIIDNDYSDTHLKGKVNVPAGDTVMFTSMPYDEGWSVYLDGKKVEIYKTCDALLAFDITEGSHEIEMKYCSKAMTYGGILTIVGILLFVAMILIDRFLLAPRLAGKHELWLEKVEEKRSEKAMREAFQSSAEEIEKAEADTSSMQQNDTQNYN